VKFNGRQLRKTLLQALAGFQFWWSHWRPTDWLRRHELGAVLALDRHATADRSDPGADQRVVHQLVRGPVPGRRL